MVNGVVLTTEHLELLFVVENTLVERDIDVYDLKEMLKDPLMADLEQAGMVVTYSPGVFLTRRGWQVASELRWHCINQGVFPCDEGCFENFVMPDLLPLNEFELNRLQEAAGQLKLAL